MAFHKVNFGSLVKFNSAISSQFISFYENFVVKKLQGESGREKARTFAPSSMRCDRKSWFRLRGTEPDILENPDVGLNFRAEIGTARHLTIQTNLKNALSDDWISVNKYLQEYPIPYDYEITQNGLESLIHIKKPPIRFACDGILRFSGKIFLLEIKTVEYNSWESLTDPKETHMDQIKCYATLLNIHDVLVLYEDRQYGGLKCYQLYITDNDFNTIINKFNYIQRMVDANLAPDRLATGDYMCNNCEYKKKCKEWG